MILQQGLGANYINGSDIVASNLSADGTSLWHLLLLEVLEMMD